MNRRADIPLPLEEEQPAEAAPSRSPGRSTRDAGGLDQRVRQLRLSHIPDSRFTLGGLARGAIGAAVALGLIAGVVVAPYYLFTLATAKKKGTVNPSSPVAANTQNNQDSPAADPLPAAPNPPATSVSPSGNSQPAPAPQPLPRLSKSEIALESKGYIVPAHQILVSPKVSGMILSLNIEEGRRVNKGDVLAILEAVDYDADVARAEATVRLAEERLREMENGNRPEEVQQAQAELAETEAQLKQLELEWKRMVDLRRNASISQQELEQAESSYEVMRQRAQRLSFRVKLLQLGERVERREMGRFELAQAQADLAKARWRQGNCTIRAPISGTILKKNAEEGNIVNPVAFNGSFSLCEMADLADLEVELDIQERDIGAVKVGQLCRVRNDAYPDRVYEGMVDRLMPIADRAKAAVPVRVKLRIPPEEEGVYLKPQMGAVVTFLNKMADWAPGKSPLPKMPLSDGGSTGFPPPPAEEPAPGPRK